MKKYRMIVLLLAALMTLGACAKGGQEATTTVEEETRVLPGGGTTTVYVITKDKKDKISKKEVLGAGAVAEQAGYIVKEAYHGDDAAKQTKWMEKAIEEKAAAIICRKAAAGETDADVAKADEAGIPVFFIEASEAEKEAEAAGKDAGQQMVDYFANK